MGRHRPTEGVYLADPGLCADRFASCDDRDFRRRGSLLWLAGQESWAAVRFADGGRMGICLPGRHDHTIRSRWAISHGRSPTRAMPRIPLVKRPPMRWASTTCRGNVFQWCRDWYAPYATPGPLTDPVQTHDNLADKPQHMLRGGSWLREAKDCRSAARYKNSAGSRNADNGFRVVAAVELEKKPQAVPAPLPAEVPDTGPAPSSGGQDIVLGPSDMPTTTRQRCRRNGRYAPPDSDGGGIVWLAVVLIAGGAIVAAVIAMVRRSNATNSQPFGTNVTGRPFGPQSQPNSTGSSSTVSRIVSDGFWLGLLNLSPGSSVRYRWHARRSAPHRPDRRTDRNARAFHLYGSDTGQTWKSWASSRQPVMRRLITRHPSLFHNPLRIRRLLRRRGRSRVTLPHTDRHRA